jgi:lactate dehydrogenase-like 2-hydroxyacid dehydrogenase
MKDGEVDHLWPELPLFKTVTWPLSVHATVGERAMLHKLGDLYDQWYDALRIQEAEERGDVDVPEVPTLYGVTASHTVMAFVSYAPPTEETEQPQLRLIAMFDFGLEGYDVWHALAMAIFVTHCRNRMMQLKEVIPEPELLTETDPDL